ADALCQLHFFITQTHLCSEYFFFNDTRTTEIYTLSLHDALPILRFERPSRLEPSDVVRGAEQGRPRERRVGEQHATLTTYPRPRSEEHTSELQSLAYLVCRLLLEKKKKQRTKY